MFNDLAKDVYFISFYHSEQTYVPIENTYNMLYTNQGEIGNTTISVASCINIYQKIDYFNYKLKEKFNFIGSNVLLSFQKIDTIPSKEEMSKEEIQELHNNYSDIFYKLVNKYVLSKNYDFHMKHIEEEAKELNLSLTDKKGMEKLYLRMFSSQAINNYLKFIKTDKYPEKPQLGDTIDFGNSCYCFNEKEFVPVLASDIYNHQC